jgi:hypothetical protein
MGALRPDCKYDDVLSLKLNVVITSALTVAPILTHPYSGQQGWKTTHQPVYQKLLKLANCHLQQKGSPFSRKLMR